MSEKMIKRILTGSTTLGRGKSKTDRERIHLTAGQAFLFTEAEVESLGDLTRAPVNETNTGTADGAQTTKQVEPSSKTVRAAAKRAGTGQTVKTRPVARPAPAAKSPDDDDL